MAIFTVDQYVNGWCSRVSCALAALVAIIAFLHQIYQIRKYLRKGSLEWNNTLTFSLVLPVFVFLQNGVFTFWASFFDVFHLPTCTVLMFGSIICYAGAKFSLYMVLSFRLGMYTILICLSHTVAN